jgi:hypothetical protein
MVAKVIKPTQDAFTLALKAQTGIITVKDFKFNVVKSVFELTTSFDIDSPF